MTEKELDDLFKSHANSIDRIKELDAKIDELAPFQIAKLEYLYSQAERQAWRIAGHYKKLYKYHEGMAEIAQGQEYKAVRTDKSSNTTNSTDGQYMSRIAKGEQLTKAAEYEGDFLTWRGVAGTYERAANSLKDMIKAITANGGEQSA